MKLAVIGTGKIINDALIAIKEAGDIELAAILARPHSREKGLELASSHGIPALYTDYDELLDQTYIDTVYIGLINSVHYEYARRALEKGKNVILEKPFTGTLEEAEDLFRIADEKGCFIFEAITKFHEAKDAAADALAARMNAGRVSEDSHVMILSYDTDNIYIQNAAFAYDNALALMAFISDGRQEEAQQLADTFVYALENDRSGVRRVRNAYAGGDINAARGQWDGAKMPGWYDKARAEWLEDRYQTGSNVGNTSYAALALLQYRNRYGGDRYLEAAKAMMDWVLDNCSDKSGGDGFTAGFDGWEEADPPVVYTFTYKSIEHNIDAYAAFSQLYGDTGAE